MGRLLTPSTTGRDNRRTLTITGGYCRGGLPPRGSSAKARRTGEPLWALVCLRDGLTGYVFKVSA